MGGKVQRMILAAIASLIWLGVTVAILIKSHY